MVQVLVPVLYEIQGGHIIVGILQGIDTLEESDTGEGIAERQSVNVTSTGAPDVLRGGDAALLFLHDLPLR